MPRFSALIALLVLGCAPQPMLNPTAPYPVPGERRAPDYTVVVRTRDRLAAGVREGIAGKNAGTAIANIFANTFPGFCWSTDCIPRAIGQPR